MPHGAYRRVIDPADFARVFGYQPRGAMMLTREIVLGARRRGPRHVSVLS
jgi:hypothetical protein